MNNSKLLEMLAGLNPSELKDFGRYLSSPYFNQSKAIRAFYQCIKQPSPHFTISKSEIYRQVFPGEKYNEKRITELTYRFTRHLEKFLVLSEFNTDETRCDILLMRSFRKRNMIKNFESARNSFNKRLESNVNSEIYSFRAEAEMESFVYSYEKSMSKSGEHFSRVFANIDHAYILKKMQQLSRIQSLNHSVRGDSKYDMWFMDEVKARVEGDLPYFKKEHPLIYVYYLISLLTPGNTEKYYKELKHFTARHKSKFTPAELRRIYINMLNYCVVRSVDGDEAGYIQDAYNIYTFLDRNSLLAEQKHVLWFDLVNIVAIGIEVGDIEWAEKLLNKYSRMVIPYVEKDTLNLLRAKVFFYKKKFNEALKLIIRLNFPYYLHYMDAKMLLIMIHYETGEIEGALPAIDSLRHYIKRKEMVPPHYKSIYLDFVKYTTRLIRINDSVRNYKHLLDALKHDVEENKKVIGRRWLLEMILKESRNYRP